MAQAVSLLLIVLLLAALIVAVLPSALADVDFSPVMQIIDRDHAVKKHGGEALAIRDSCNNGGRRHLLRSQSHRTPDRFFEVCKLDDGGYGLRIREWSKKRCDWIEITSFIPGDGTYRHVWEYVTARADEVFPGTLDRYSC